MKQIATHTFQNIWQTIRSIIFLSTLLSLPVSVYAVESLCAVVKIEIKQELTLERQAFDAHMRINNGLSNIQLENVEINVSFADEDGNSVRATSDANDTSASFFIKVPSMEGINDVSGSGTVAPSTSADIHWLIIPVPGSGGILPSGKMYYVGATLKYTLGGEEHTTEVTPDYIFVKPQPLLTLDYFLPNDVYADDAFTPEIEPSIPFTLGVRVKNDGQGTAYNLKIDSAQPKIVENKQGLLIGFKIIGSTVNNQPATPSLLVDFGDIEAAQSAVGRWQMTTTLSGQFTEFTAEFYHADELGGELTSLLQATQTHFLVKDVLVDLQGRDEVRDFLAKDGGVLRVYESHGLDTEVNDHSANTTLQPMSQTGSQVTYRLNAPVTAGFLYVKLPDPHQGAKAIDRAIRSDGKQLPLENVWLSKTRREDNGWDYFINLFDNNSSGQYQITLDTANLAPQPPVLQFIPDRSRPETKQIAFLVEASDPNGTIPTLSAASLPTGARFAMEGEGKAVFDWTPVKGQAGDYDITFTAADEALKTAQTARITVHSITDDSDSDGMLDSCEMQYFGNIDKEGSGDFDGDGLSDREECLQGTDPTVKMPNLLINEVDALVAGTETTEFIEFYDGGTGNIPLDGLVVVLFNGDLDKSYTALDLDGFTTNATGYFVIGGSELTGADMTVSNNDWLADGADAVALYLGDDTDFPEGSAVVVTAKLLDALVYDTDDTDDTGLLPLLNLNEPQINEGRAGNAESHSIGRCENGAGGQRNTNNYIQAAPTPGVANNCQANLSLTKADSADPVNTSANFSYTLTVSNAGPDAASNVQVVDTLPADVSFVSASGTDWTCSEASGTVTCELASLAVGAADPITINVTAPSTAGELTNQATVSAATADLDTANNSASEATTIDTAAPSAQANLSLTKADSVDPVNTSANFSYTLAVSNAGPDVASNVQVVDTLPSGVSFGSASGTDWTCNEVGGIVTCELASLAVGAAAPITINVTAPSTAGDITNTATVGAATADLDTANNNASEVTTIDTAAPSAQANLSLTNADSVDPVNTSANFSYTLMVNNAGPDTASNVQVVDTLPADVSFVSANGTDWTCNEVGGTVTCELASLAVGAADPITINVTAPSTAGDITNQATVSAATADLDTANNSASEVTTIDTAAPSAQANLSLTKTDSADPVNTSASFSYTLTVNNAGPDAASNVQVVDTLPADVSFVSANGMDWTCSEASGTVTCELASLAVGAANPITINVTAPSTAGELTNQATVSAATADPDTANNSASEVTTIDTAASSAQANLSLTNADSVDPVNTSASFSYTLTVNNAGPDAASNVQVVDTLPADVSFVSANGMDWTCSEASGTVTCELASLAVGAANPITINVTAPSTAGELTNQATVSAATADPDTANNSASEVTTIDTAASSAQANLSLTKTDSADPVNTSASFSYTLIVSNAGPDAASNVQVVDTLPAGVSFGSASGTDWTCNEVGGTVTCELASLAVGAADPITINVTAPSTAGDITNQATVNAATADPDTSNNNASEATTIDTAAPSAQADLSLTKADSADPVNTSASFSYTLTVNNAGPDAASNVQVVDTLPAGVSFGSASGTDWTCSEASGTVTCELASLAVGAADPITINVTAPSTPGELTNQATVNAATADPDTSNNSASETTMVNALPQPPVLHTLTVKTVGNGTVTANGIDCGNDCEESYSSSTHVTLTAIPDTDWQFDSFSDDCDSNGQVNMSSDKSCTAIFTQMPVATSVISFAISESKVKENSDIATITVTRTGSAIGEITVDYATSDGTAQASQDYQTVIGTLIWRDSEQSEQTFTVDILDNTTLDGDKTLILSLGNLTGAGASLAIDTATLTIVDDEVPQPGTLQFANSTATVNEAAQTITLTVNRVGGSDGELVVNYATADGTATASHDYAETTGKLTWANGDSSDKTLMVAITDDAEIEGDEMFTVTLSDEANGENLDSATVFISDNDTVVVVPSPACPANGLINSTCNAEGQTLVNVIVVHQHVSIANAILEGTIPNHGWISNSTVQPGAELIGGIVSGYMTNKGTMKDFDFRGALVKGGTLSGDIFNNSQVGGAFQDVHLTANTRISGGQLRGVITGEAPAWLENLEVIENSHLSGVIISDTVHLGDNVVLGEGVRFTHQQLIPTDLELTALLPALPLPDCADLLTQLKRSDLSADVLEPGEGFLTAINALPDFKDNGWLLTQEADCGTLQLTVDTLRYAVQPLSITRTNHQAALEVFDQQRVRFTTDMGITILTHPAVQAPQTLQTRLADLGLPVVILQNNGNLSISATDEDKTWFSARPDWASVALGSEPETAPETGLFLEDSPYLSGVSTAYVVFTDQNGKHRQQYFHAAPAMPEALYSTAQKVVIAPDGLVSFKLGKRNYHGVLDYLVTKGTQPARDKLQVEPISDTNGDGKADWMLIYPDGDRQVLFQSDSLP